MKIAAVIATYNRKKLLKECLQALLSQTRPLDEIIVVDGHSTDGTNLMMKLEFPQITYIRLMKNMGASGHFYEGMKLAYKKGHDWIWVMDDDSEPKRNTLEELIKWSNLDGVVALTPVVRNEYMEIQKEQRGNISFDTIFPYIQKPLTKEKYCSNTPVEITFTSFVGPLISREAISKVGFPRKEFFIYHDDVEYSMRLMKIGRIYLIPTAYVIHKVKTRSRDLIEKKFFRKKVYIVPYYNLWRSYYGTRNIVYLGRLYSTNKLKFITSALKLWSRSTIRIILFEDHKIRRLLFVTSAYVDGLHGVFDNTKPKKILYGEKC
ncbi:MAG: glycosyltransferase family 2 protein [Thermoprotei archaeon]